MPRQKESAHAEKLRELGFEPVDERTQDDVVPDVELKLTEEERERLARNESPPWCINPKSRLSRLMKQALRGWARRKPNLSLTWGLRT